MREGETCQDMESDDRAWQGIAENGHGWRKPTGLDIAAVSVTRTVPIQQHISTRLKKLATFVRHCISRYFVKEKLQEYIQHTMDKWP